MGYGSEISELTLDDSTLLMQDGLYGNVGEYTWRDSFETDPTSLNPWKADDSNSQDFIDLFTGSLYSMYFDESKTGYEIKGDLASGEPIAIDSEIINGKEYATTWQISVEDNLSWTYHPDTDTSSFEVGHEDLDANDFVWTWKYALENDWFRAVAGGGDFISKGIKNASEFVDGTVSWEDVGIKLINDNTIELEFYYQKSVHDVKYAMVDSWQPLNEDLFMTLGENEHGLNPETIASSGAYIFDEWVAGQRLFFVKNDNYASAEMYQFTGREYSFHASEETAFQDFIEGKLDTSPIPTDRVEEFLDDLRMHSAPDMTTYRLAINGFGTEENRDAYIEQYPDMGINETYTPEPILQYLEMKQALQFGIDRNGLIDEAQKFYVPAYTLFSPTYFVDNEGGLSIRGTSEGASILDDFGKGTDGYEPSMAVEYFKQAVTKAISDGFYTAGTAENYTTIEINFLLSNLGEYGSYIGSNIEEQYESILVDDENFVNVDIVLVLAGSYMGYNNSILTAGIDLAITGISGSLLCPLSFLDTFRDDNPTGFTFNYGIDTHSVNVPLSYRNIEGEIVHELWSFNALSEAFIGKTYIKDGDIQTVFDIPEDVISVELEFYNKQLSSVEDGTVIAEMLIGKTLADYAIELEVDTMHAYIVATVDGYSSIYFISESDSGYRFIDQMSIADNATDAIKSHSGFEDMFVSNDGQLVDDDAIAQSVYLTMTYDGLNTLAEVAEHTGATIEYMEVYSVTWSGWSDVYVVLHIGDYYIGWEWL